MPDKSLLGKNGSRAIILLTDGIDNASALSNDDLAALLEAVDVPIYPIGLRSPGAPVFPAPGQSVEGLLNLEILGHMARITGGRLAIVDEPPACRIPSGSSRRTFAPSIFSGSRPRARGPCASAASLSGSPVRSGRSASGPATRVRLRPQRANNTTGGLSK